MTLSTKQIIDGISKVKTSGKEFDRLVQSLLVATSEQVHKHGNITYICNLYASLPNGAKRKAARDWMLDFGGVLLNDNKETKKEQPFVYNKAKNNCNPVAGADKNWYDYKKESLSAPKPFVLDDKLMTLVKAARKAEAITCMADIDTLVDAFRQEMEELLDTTAIDNDDDNDDEV